MKYYKLNQFYLESSFAFATFAQVEKDERNSVRIQFFRGSARFHLASCVTRHKRDRG